MPRRHRTPAEIYAAATLEDSSHKAILDYLRKVLPRAYTVHHSPNGGKRSKREGAEFRRLGTIAGYPDLVITGPGGATYYIEVKRPVGGDLEEAQKAFKADCLEYGKPWALCRTIDEAREALASWDVMTIESAS